MALKHLTLAAASALIALPLAAQETPRAPSSDLSPQQRLQLRREIRDFLVEHPEVLLEALQILEERQAAEAATADERLVAQHSAAIFEDGYSFVGGNPEGDLTVVEFSDYRCPYCKRAHPDIDRLIAEDGNIRLITKEYPILGPDSMVAGRMALAAVSLDESKFKELKDQLMTFRGNLTETAAYRIAGRVGYDIRELRARADSPEIAEQIRANHALAQTLGLRGTPSFIVGDEILRGFLPYDDMVQVVATVRARQQSQAN
ncbi:MAG: DsbA family protein [Pseudomonadota bacterium]